MTPIAMDAKFMVIIFGDWVGMVGGGCGWIWLVVGLDGYGLWCGGLLQREEKGERMRPFLGRIWIFGHSWIWF
ncbi:unnamed protein product [Prunus armeniaca]